MKCQIANRKKPYPQTIMQTNFKEDTSITTKIKAVIMM